MKKIYFSVSPKYEGSHYAVWAGVEIWISFDKEVEVIFSWEQRGNEYQHFDLLYNCEGGIFLTDSYLTPLQKWEVKLFDTLKKPVYLVVAPEQRVFRMEKVENAQGLYVQKLLTDR